MIRVRQVAEKRYNNSPVQLMLKDDLGYNVYPLPCFNLRYQTNHLER